MILIADAQFAYYKTQAQKEKFQREICIFQIRNEICYALI
jgi:hypothetical protein